MRISLTSPPDDVLTYLTSVHRQLQETRELEHVSAKVSRLGFDVIEDGIRTPLLSTLVIFLEQCNVAGRLFLGDCLDVVIGRLVPGNHIEQSVMVLGEPCRGHLPAHFLDRLT